MYFLLVIDPTMAGQVPVPVVDGESGTCSVELTAIQGAGAPVFGATIQVHVEYGFLNLRRLDLEVITNADGRARFEGLPDDTDGVLYFEASKQQELRGVAVYYPPSECHGHHYLFMSER